MRATPFFPNSVWDGSTPSRPGSNPLYYNLDPTIEDYDQLVAEIIAMQNYILNNIQSNTPSFSSFSVNISTPQELGAIIPAGSYLFEWTTMFTSQIVPNSISISLDPTILGDMISPELSSISLDISSDILSDTTFTISALDTSSNVFSRTYSIVYLPRIYYGTSASATLDEAGIKSLFFNPLQAAFNGTYSFSGGDYKYWAFPDSFGSPNLFNASNNFPIDMAQVTDDAFYANVENNYYYGLVDVTNDNDIIISYRVYRTHFQLGGTLIAILS